MKKEKALRIFRYLGAAALIVMYIFFWFNKDYYVQTSTIDGISSPDYLLKRILFVTLVTAGGAGLCLWKFKLSEKVNKIAAWVMFAVTPFVSFFALEYANISETRILWQVVEALGKRRCLVSVLILIVLMLGVYVISNSLKIASMALSIFVCIFGTVCYFVYAFRGIPFLASDLTIMGTAFNVMADYEYYLGFQAFILILITFVWCAGLCSLKNVKGFGWKVRIPAAVCYVLILALSVHTLVYTKFLKEEVRVSVNTFMPQKSYAKSGALLTVIRSIQYIMVEKPEDYKSDEIPDLAQSYLDQKEEDTVNPNVIVIMDEAFADLQAIADFDTNEEVMPFFDSLKENTVRGEMYVSVFGGQTANTEFEVLTGNSKAFLPASSTPYQLFIKNEFPSLTYTLKDRGYQGNIAMHPYKPSGYNRANVYPLMGFDQFLYRDHFENPKLVRNFISDETDFERIISEYEAAKKKSSDPFYLFNVTMQNHSGYDMDFDNLPKKIKITDEAYQDDQAERYLNLIHLSDQALQMLVEYFEKVEEPTVIVFFGDHEPGIHESFYKKLFGMDTGKLSDEELMQKYKVPYIIWANYDIEEKENVTTSANYLSALMLKSAGMELTGYSRFLMEASEEIPVLTSHGYFGADGKFYKLTDKTSPYYETLKKYEKLQYNNMFDSENRVQDFFD